MKTLKVLTMVVGVVGMVGCAHQAPVVTNPLAETKPAPTAPAAAAATPSPSACSLDSDCRSGQLCIQSLCKEITPELAECSMFRVHFDFDRSDIHQSDRSQLERMARCLRGDQAMRVTIEGNADERGTEDYNLHLGDRRASAVDRYLTGLGVSQSQLKTISYGKDRPLCSEHEEACWSQNRRAALKPAIVAVANQ